MVSMLNIVVGIYIYQFIPDSRVVPMKLWRAIFRLGFDLAYRVEVKGAENFKRQESELLLLLIIYHILIHH